MDIDIASFVGGVVIAAGFHLVASKFRQKESNQVIDLRDGEASYNQEIKDELYSRVMSFFGSEKFAELEDCFVVVRT